MNIIESITRTGIASTSGPVAVQRRLETPRSGDHVRWEDGTLGRIWEVGEGHCRPDQAQVCENQGRAFLLNDGRADMSGGPFRMVALADLHPTLTLAWGIYWNWGDNRSGAGMDVEFQIARPVFRFCPAT